MTKRKEPRQRQIPPIYIVSGGVGASGEQVARTALAQFQARDVPVIVVPHVRRIDQIRKVVEQAAANQGTILHTLVDVDLRRSMTRIAREKNAFAIDLMGRVLVRLSDVLGEEPLGKPGLYRQMREDYFDRVDAIEFAVAHDDGRKPEELNLAEIVLVGPSRVGKTPLSMYLSVLGWKVANVPIVKGINLPEELFRIDRRRVVGLIIEPAQLLAHRHRRQRRLASGGGLSYTDPLRIQDELESAQLVFRRGHFPVIDVTDKPIEESADEVLGLITRHFREAGQA